MPHRMTSYRTRCLATASLALCVGACSTPFEAETGESLKRSVLDSIRSEMSDTSARPLSAEVEPIDLTEARLKELNTMAGPRSYEGEPLPEIGPDLAGNAANTYEISLEQAIQSAVRHNLRLQDASFSPAISAEQLTLAESVFDWVFFADTRWNALDEPQLGTSFGAGRANVRKDLALSAGFRKRLTSGGELTFSQSETYSDISSPGVTFVPDPSNAVGFSARLDQPLLRGFGREVTLAEVRLAESAQRASVQQLRDQLIATVTDTERAYWNLATAYRSLRIQQRLLDRGEEVRRRVEARLELDATPAAVFDARSQVEFRRANVIRATNALRQASDALKIRMNDPAYPIESEVLLEPVDAPVSSPVELSFFDAVTTALDRRPEIEQAILTINDTSIRVAVADNGRLPALNLAAQANFDGLAENLGDALDEEFGGDYASYIVSLTFEQALGNRGPEAFFRQRQLERLRAMNTYRLAVQTVLLEVKTALRNLQTNYQLIEQTRIARLAATENLRTLEVQGETTRGFTPEFLDLQFTRQRALADAELQEIQALADYSVGLAEYYAATGSTLARLGIRVAPPTSRELLGPTSADDE